MWRGACYKSPGGTGLHPGRLVVVLGGSSGLHPGRSVVVLGAQLDFTLAGWWLSWGAHLDHPPDHSLGSQACDLAWVSSSIFTQGLGSFWTLSLLSRDCSGPNLSMSC